MAAKLKQKRTSITTIRTKCRLIATFHRPIHSHWSLPLRKEKKKKLVEGYFCKNPDLKLIDQYSMITKFDIDGINLFHQYPSTDPATIFLSIITKNIYKF
jgi:hypothetical protein